MLNRNNLALGVAAAVFSAALIPSVHAAVFASTVYYANSAKVCPNAAICVLDTLAAAPSDKVLIVRQVSCAIRASNTAVFHFVQVGEKFAAQPTSVANAQYLDVPKLLGEDPSQNYYQLNSQTMAPVNKSGAPAIRVVLKSAVPDLALFCSVAGDLR